MTSNRADVAVTSAGDQWTLVFARVLRHPPAAVWDALTDPAALAQWAPFEADRGLDHLGAATITMIDGDIRLDSPSEVRLAERPRLLEYTWGEDLLRWELTPVDAGTQLTLRHTHGNRSWIPKLAAGWDLTVGTIDDLLDGKPVTPIRGRAALNYGFAELERGYADDLGIEPE
jgi:uncharacterized protein YndB with AHSA1/START domain